MAVLNDMITSLLVRLMESAWSRQIQPTEYEIDEYRDFPELDLSRMPQLALLESNCSLPHIKPPAFPMGSRVGFKFATIPLVTVADEWPLRVGCEGAATGLSITLAYHPSNPEDVKTIESKWRGFEPAPPAPCMDPRSLQSAVRLLIPGELGKHAVSEGAKAVSKIGSTSPQHTWNLHAGLQISPGG